MDDALVFLGGYAIFALLVILKPLFSYVRSLRGVRVKLVTKEGKERTKVVYFRHDDPLYLQLKKDRGL